MLVAVVKQIGNIIAAVAVLLTQPEQRAVASPIAKKDALDCAISLLNILDESNPNDMITIGETMAASNIDK